MIDQTSIVLEKLTFNHIHAYTCIYVKGQMPTLDHDLNKLWRPRSQCFIPSFKVPSFSVLEKKIFKGFLPYLDVVAILVKRLEPFE